MDELLLLSGQPIPFPEGLTEIHQPRLKEIALLGEAKFYISSKEEMYSFYGNGRFTAKCFMLKADLVA
jgi:ribosome biogenesis protein Nip4